MKDCKIIQDLLPNYIDKSTNAETNDYIEGHLEKCDDCKQIFENMKEEISIPKTKADTKKEINYLKRFKRKMNLLKGALLIILIIFVLIIGRRTVILMQLSQKAKLNKEINNYHSILRTYQDDVVSIIETYCNGTDYITTTTVYSPDSSKRKGVFYQKDEEYITIAEIDGEKIINISESENIPVGISSPATYVSEGFWQNLKYAFIVGIDSTYCNGRECYVLKGNNYERYIDKETGLIVRSIDKSTKNLSRTIDPVTDHQYQFNVVKDSDIVRPDTTNYSETEQ